MVAKLRLIFTFYRRFIAMASIATLLIVYVWLIRQGDFASAFYTKLGISIGFIAITHFTYSREYYYYRNRGVRPGALWAGSLAMDILIFLSVFTPIRAILS